MKGFDFTVESKVSRISEQYAKKANISINESIRKFLASKTYELLSDEKTGIYLEVIEYVYDIYLEELGEIES